MDNFLYLLALGSALAIAAAACVAAAGSNVHSNLKSTGSPDDFADANGKKATRRVSARQLKTDACKAGTQATCESALVNDTAGPCRVTDHTGEKLDFVRDPVAEVGLKEDAITVLGAEGKTINDRCNTAAGSQRRYAALH